MASTVYPPNLGAIVREYTHFTRVTRCEQVACYTLMVYDWLLCFEHEVGLLKVPTRRHEVSPAKVTYVFCRYWPLLTYPLILWGQVIETDPATCARIFRLPLFLAIVNFSAAASVLIVRIYAFARRNTGVAVGLACAFLASGALQVWAVATQIELVPDAPACFPQNKHPSNKALSWYFFAPFLFDLVATSVFVYCAAQIQFARNQTSSRATGVFIREGIVYFLAISTINLGNAAMSFQPRVGISGTLAAFSMSMPNILACRLVINLRNPESTQPKQDSGRDLSTHLGFSAARPPRSFFDHDTGVDSIALSPMRRDAEE